MKKVSTKGKITIGVILVAVLSVAAYFYLKSPVKDTVTVELGTQNVDVQLFLEAWQQV